MDKLSDFQGKLTDYGIEDQKRILKTFVNSIILDLNAHLSQEEIGHMQSRVHESLNKAISIRTLKEIHSEIIGCYKRYLPFCFASIVTASNEVNKSKK